MSKNLVARKAVVLVMVLAIAVVGMLALAPAASAQTGGESLCFRDPYGGLVCPSDEVRDPKTHVEADILERPDTPPPDNPPDSPLPFTGADVTLFLVTGAAMVLTGAVLVRRARTRRSEV